MESDDMCHTSTLFIGNIEPWMTPEFVCETLLPLYPPSDVKFLRRQDGNICGYGFIGFPTSEAANQCLTHYAGRRCPLPSAPNYRIKLNHAVRRDQMPAPRRPTQPPARPDAPSLAPGLSFDPYDSPYTTAAAAPAPARQPLQGMPLYPTPGPVFSSYMAPGGGFMAAAAPYQVPAMGNPYLQLQQQQQQFAANSFVQFPGFASYPGMQGWGVPAPAPAPAHGVHVDC